MDDDWQILLEARDALIAAARERDALRKAAGCLADVYSDEMRVVHSSDTRAFDTEDGLCIMIWRPDWKFDTAPEIGKALRALARAAGRET